jgi:hypothetical protein
MSGWFGDQKVRVGKDSAEEQRTIVEKGKLKVEADARASPYVERGKGKAES